MPHFISEDAEKGLYCLHRKGNGRSIYSKEPRLNVAK